MTTLKKKTKCHINKVSHIVRYKYFAKLDTNLLFCFFSTYIKHSLLQLLNHSGKYFFLILSNFGHSTQWWYSSSILFIVHKEQILSSYGIFLYLSVLHLIFKAPNLSFARPPSRPPAHPSVPYGSLASSSSNRRKGRIGQKKVKRVKG